MLNDDQLGYTSKRRNLPVNVGESLNAEESLSVRSPVAIKCAMIGPLSRYRFSTETLLLGDRPTHTIPYVKDGLLSHQWWCPISGILLTEVSDLYNWMYGEIVGFYRHVSAKQCRIFRQNNESDRNNSFTRNTKTCKMGNEARNNRCGAR